MPRIAIPAVLTVALGLSLASAALAATPRYRCILIPGTEEANDVNNLGEVVGRTTGGQAFYYKSGTLTPFGPGGENSYAYAISDSGHIAGVEDSGGLPFAMIGDREGNSQLVGQNYSEAWDINNEGLAVGWQEDEIGIQHAHAWGAPGAGRLDGGPEISAAYGVNNVGSIVGMFDGDASFFDGTPMPIGGVPGHSSAALAISDSGVVVGLAFLGAGQFAAWRVDGGGADILSSGPNDRWAWDVNRFGHVVGFADGEAFLYDDEGYHPLADLVEDGPALTFLEARGINDAGVIAGVAKEGGFLLVPIDSVAPGNADLDGDGLIDRWEVHGLDLDVDGVREYRLEGADPRHKDLFVEVDHVPTVSFKQQARDALVAAFAAVPGGELPSPNPDGAPGITLHLLVDEGDVPLGGAPEVQLTGPSVFPAEFDLLKPMHFGTKAERADPDADRILLAKRRAFRYGQMWDGLVVPDPGFGRRISGIGECSGNDFIVATGMVRPTPDTWQEQAGTFMHEIGHTLGLLHGGGDNVNHKVNYFSVMNYTWQVPLAALGTDKWVLDYSATAANPTLLENALDEGAGLGGISRDGAAVPVLIAIAGDTNQVRAQPVGVAPFDFNGDQGYSAAPQAVDLNHIDPKVPASPGEVHADHDDWAVIALDFSQSPSFEEGAHPACPGAGVLEFSDELYGILEAVLPPDPVAVEEGPVSPRAGLDVRPNPFTGAAQIRFSLATGGPLRVTVHDVEGRRIRTLLSGARPAGPATLLWDGRDDGGRTVGAGIYFVRVHTATATHSARVVRVR
jgi:hypothetical protein